MRKSLGYVLFALISVLASFPAIAVNIVPLEEIFYTVQFQSITAPTVMPGMQRTQNVYQFDDFSSIGAGDNNRDSPAIASVMYLHSQDPLYDGQIVAIIVTLPFVFRAEAIAYSPGNLLVLEVLAPCIEIVERASLS